MKKSMLLSNFVLAALLNAELSTLAQSSWQTTDDFQYTPGKAARGYAVATAPDGTLFVASSAADAANVAHGLVRRSVDAGATWQIVLDVNPHLLTSIAVGPAGQ